LIHAIVAEFRQASEIPGFAVAPLHPEKPDLIRGYGVRALGRPMGNQALDRRL